MIIFSHAVPAVVIVTFHTVHVRTTTIFLDHYPAIGTWLLQKEVMEFREGLEVHTI